MTIEGKKKKEENAVAFKYLEGKICNFNNDIATITNYLQNQIESLRVEVTENDSKVNDEEKPKIKCITGFCRMKENCPGLHKTLTICEIHKSGINCELILQQRILL